MAAAVFPARLAQARQGRVFVDATVDDWRDGFHDCRPTLVLVSMERRGSEAGGACRVFFGPYLLLSLLVNPTPAVSLDAAGADVLDLRLGFSDMT